MCGLGSWPFRYSPAFLRRTNRWEKSKTPMCRPVIECYWIPVDGVVYYTAGKRIAGEYRAIFRGSSSSTLK